ncbi:MAG: hypothetical protein K6A75_07410 [Ruminococcus sp.]|nr:hypothetical protein [Ruminococcus sp.]
MNCLFASVLSFDCLDINLTSRSVSERRPHSWRSEQVLISFAQLNSWFDTNLCYQRWGKAIQV